MSTVSSTSSSGSTTFGNAPAVTFPGLVSGIDYDSIINELTSVSETQIQTQQTSINTYTSKNNELLKINGLLASVQASMTSLSDPTIFQAYSGTSSDTSVATATGIPSAVATPGTYTIDSTQLATSTVVTGASASVTAKNMMSTVSYQGATVPASQAPLADGYLAITPINGTTGNGQGEITVDGVQVAYDVNSDTLQAVLSRIQSAVNAAGDTSFTASYNATTDEVSFSSTQEQISIGSPKDSGNLTSVLKLDTAEVNNAGGTNSVTSSGPIDGLNLGADLDGTTSANFVTPVTAGIFTINGTKITVDPTSENLNDVINSINSSGAGVVASYDQETGQVSLTATATGPQSIVIGGTQYGDSSNFLNAVGLARGTGATMTVGSQASITMQQPGGGTRTFYSNSNTVTNAIPGMAINVTSTDTSTPFTITVAQNSTPAVSAINTFISAYNAALNEINTALAPPVVSSTTASQGADGATTGSSATLASGGTLYGDLTLESIRDRLINLSTGLVSYNGSQSSLSAIGLDTSDSFSELGTSSSSSSSSSSSTDGISEQTMEGTDGTFNGLNVSAFAAALAANPQEVANLFTGSNGIVSQVGAYLTSVTGTPTLLASGIAGNVSSVAINSTANSNETFTSLLQTDQDTNTDEISSLNQYIAQLTDQANLQANNLRAQFSDSETLISKYDSEQSDLSQLLNNL